MAKKATKQAPKQVRIRIKPLHGIGGVGNAGDTAWMDPKEAEQYEQDGYLEILPDADEPVPSSKGTPAGQLELGDAPDDEPADEAGEAGEEDPNKVPDPAIFPPESKRK